MTQEFNTFNTSFIHNFHCIQYPERKEETVYRSASTIIFIYWLFYKHLLEAVAKYTCLYTMMIYFIIGVHV